MRNTKKPNRPLAYLQAALCVACMSVCICTYTYIYNNNNYDNTFTQWKMDEKWCVWSNKSYYLFVYMLQKIIFIFRYRLSHHFLFDFQITNAIINKNCENFIASVELGLRTTKRGDECGEHK